MLIILLFIIFSFSTTTIAANSIDHWETVIYANDTWNYTIGDHEPDENWVNLLFNDTAWDRGPGGIGYGDDDDLTQIDNCISVYMRIKFTIFDPAIIESVMLHVDYDDAFIAYINGVEVARAGISGIHPPNDQLADSNHEAQIPAGNPPLDFTIHQDLVNTVLQPGENVLALQVHNVSSNSSDLSSTTFLSVGVTDISRQYRPTPSWFVEPFTFSSSNIPIIAIDTYGKTIVDEPKIRAHMGIIDNGKGNRNSTNDPFNEYDGWIGIEYRGNASLDISDKKPFTFETRNADDTDRNVELLGMPKENDFILRASYIDKTLMRDALGYYLSRSLGRWAPRTRHVELVLNGNYEGVYVLEEKIKPDKNRLDIAKMDAEDIEGDAITGGYIWSVQQADANDVVFDKNEADGNKRVLKYPKPDKVTPEQLTYISQLEQEFCDVMKGDDHNNSFMGYKAYIDVSSFIDEIIIQELTSNSDAYSWSGFLHKDRGKKINAGPVWDFDQALTNSTYNDGHRYNEWIIAKPDNYRPYFWDRLFADKEFKDELISKWCTYRQDVLSNDRIFAFIDSVANYLAEAQEHNFNRWAILGVPVWRSLPGAAQRDTYRKEVDYMKEWLTDHLTWMDRQWYQDSSPIKNEGTQTASAFTLQQNYPNPFTNRTKFVFELTKSTDIQIKIYNIKGQTIKTLFLSTQARGKHIATWNGTDNTGQNVPGGVYIYTLTTGTRRLTSGKMILVR
ncbi:CotH kinase family protein [candidate division KSB1 bacterium]|nr:CotH kinase family protein [candidate division KSB1 bacterium]